ncbi:MAG TPA: hypothetical protein VF532_20605 [Candidatus Angelobacter sp.]
MPTLIDHLVEGNVISADKAIFEKHPLAVHALINGTEVANAVVDRLGHYELRFQHEREKPTTELHVASTSGAKEPIQIATAELLTPSAFSITDNRVTAYHDFTVGPLDVGPADSTRYSVYGQVFVRSKHTIEPMSGAKVNFDVMVPKAVGGAWSDDLTERYTAADGTYSASGYHKVFPNPMAQKSPYVIVSIAELANGIWTVLYSETLGNFTNPFSHHFDFLVDRK